MDLQNNEAVIEMEDIPQNQMNPELTSPTESETMSLEEEIVPATPNGRVSISLNTSVIECPRMDEMSPVFEDEELGAMEVCQGERCLSFHNISYRVSGFNGCSWGHKTILHNVSGLMLPGINTIMGPTGGGKTTLLDILAQRKASNGLNQRTSGRILLDGQPLPPNYKLLTGYVVQDDILEGILTVRENLQFSAALRLPASTTRKQRTEKVESIIAMLGLGPAADTIVGTEFIRGVSGGERKRTVIGMELIIDPQILFMDEPTTGLDAHTAVSIMQYLQDWCIENNRLVVLSIHQPRYSITKLFDTLTLLSLGSVVYQGKAAGAVPYFTKLGFGLEERENPADYYLDIINDSQSSVATRRRTIRKVRPAKQLDLISEFKGSGERASLENTLASIEATEVKTTLVHRAKTTVARSFRNLPMDTYKFFWQLLVLVIRSTISNFRNPGTVLFQVFIMSFVAFVVGVVYFQIQDVQFGILDSYVGDRIGAFFIIALTQEFGVLSGFDLFISQRALFIHENGNGFYKVSSYFVSKIITDIIPLRIIPLVFFSAITYFMIGFQLEVEKFFIYLWILALAAVTLSSISFAISAGIKNRSIAIVLFSLINLTSILFSGIIISLSILPDFLYWIQYLSVYNYVIQSLTLNEVLGQFYNTTENTTDPNFFCVTNINYCLNGTASLEFNEFRTDPEFIWISTGALIGMTLALWVITYVVLRCVKKTR